MTNKLTKTTKKVIVTDEIKKQDILNPDEVPSMDTSSVSTQGKFQIKVGNENPVMPSLGIEFQ